MTAAKRSSVSLEPLLHNALRRKSGETGRTISDLVDDAVRDALARDADDLAVIEARRSEPTRSFEAFLAGRSRRRRV